MSYKMCLTVLSASSHRPATKTLLLLLLLAFSSPSPLWHSSFARPQGSIHSFLPANKANTQMGLLSLTSFASQNCASVSPLCFSSSHSSTLIFPFPTFTLQSSVFVLCVCVCACLFLLQVEDLLWHKHGLKCTKSFQKSRLCPGVKSE